MKTRLLFLLTLLAFISCGNAEVKFNPTPEMKGSLAKFYDAKDVTVNILLDKKQKDLAGNPSFIINTSFTLVKNDITGIEEEWDGFEGISCANNVSMWAPEKDKFTWGIGLTIEDEYHNDVVTLNDGETPGGGKLLEYCITPGQEYKYVWHCRLTSVGFDTEHYKVMTKIYNGEMTPNFRILVGQNVWLGEKEMAKPTKAVRKESTASNEWDSILDDYEEYVNKYIDLLRKVKNGDTSVLTRYTSVLEKAESLANKLDTASENLTVEQAERYMKILQKMANADI